MSRRNIFTAFMWLIVVLPVLLVAGCASGGSDLTARLTAANLLAGSAAQSLAVAAEAGQIEPGSETAAAILLTLDAIEAGLDGAGAALRAGLPDMAGENLAAAESQLLALQPLLPGGP
nr:hypothetical protein [uncultured Dongia sp.]